MKCQKCNKDFIPKSSRSKFCSNSCRCKTFYYKEKKENYKRQRTRNLLASRRYKKKNIEQIRERGREYQQRTKSSLKYHDARYFDGKRNKILNLYEKKCAICQNTKGLVIHHIDGSGHSENINNNDDNLIVMCRACHAHFHYKGNLIDEDIVRTYRRL